MSELNLNDLRRNHTRLHRRILRSHVIVYCVKRSLHKCSSILKAHWSQSVA